MMSDILLNIFAGSLALSAIHALIPNHWMPIVVMGRSQGWSRAQQIKIAAVAGFAHTASSIMIGIALGLFGIQLTEVSLKAMKLVAPALFFLFGVLYMTAGIRDNLRRHGHRHIHLDEVVSRGGRTAVTSIALAMFFSPCIEIETYFFNASLAGWRGIAVVAGTYLVTTVAGIVLMADLGRRGLQAMQFRFLEHYEKHVMGLILIIMAGTFYLFLD